MNKWLKAKLLYMQTWMVELSQAMEYSEADYMSQEIALLREQIATLKQELESIKSSKH